MWIYYILMVSSLHFMHPPRQGSPCRTWAHWRWQNRWRKPKKCPLLQPTGSWWCAPSFCQICPSCMPQRSPPICCLLCKWSVWSLPGCLCHIPGPTERVQNRWYNDFNIAHVLTDVTKCMCVNSRNTLLCIIIIMFNVLFYKNWYTSKTSNYHILLSPGAPSS